MGNMRSNRMRRMYPQRISAGGFLRFNDPYPFLANAAIDKVVREPRPDAHIFHGVHLFERERVVLHEFVKVFSALFAGESLLVFVHRLREFMY